MNWNAAIRTFCACAITAALCWCVIFRLAPALDAWGKSAPPDLQPTLTRLNATLDAVNAPCTGFHGSVTCGPLAQLSQTEKNVGIVAGQSALQVKQSGVLIDAAAKSITQVSEHVNLAADSATSALATVSVDLTMLQPTIKATTPLLLNAGDAVQDIDTFIKQNSPIVHTFLTNANGTLDSTNEIAYDFKQVADKETAEFLKPVKWYMVPIKRGGQLIDIGAAVARNIP